MNDNPAPQPLFASRDEFREAISHINVTVSANGLQLAEMQVCIEAGIQSYQHMLEHDDGTLPEEHRVQAQQALDVLLPVLEAVGTALGVVQLTAEAMQAGEFTSELREQINNGPALPEGFKLH
jgi:hypothetical protein